MLHQYSHCEVPAGCGGVVLRWVDPTTTRTAYVTLVAPAAHAELWIDGHPLERAVVDLHPGWCLLAAELTSDGAASQPFALAIRWQSGTVASLAGATWRATTSRPDPRWFIREFDDSQWAAPRRAPPDTIAAQPEYLRNAFADAPHLLASRELWLRVWFEVPA